MYSYQGYEVKIVRETRFPCSKVTISNIHEAFGIFYEELGCQDREVLVAMILDTSNQLLGIHTASIGTVSEVMVHPREVFKAAILMSGSQIILAHNHPCGQLNISDEDIQITHRLKQAGEILGIEVLDHLIIGDMNFLSLKEKGYL